MKVGLIMENNITHEMNEKTNLCEMSAKPALAEAESHALSDQELINITGGYDLGLAMQYLRKVAPQNNIVRSLVSAFHTGNDFAIRHELNRLSLNYPQLFQDAVAYGSRGK